jgi:hypothetical protein
MIRVPSLYGFPHGNVAGSYDKEEVSPLEMGMWSDTLMFLSLM